MEQKDFIITFLIRFVGAVCFKQFFSHGPTDNSFYTIAYYIYFVNPT